VVTGTAEIANGDKVLILTEVRSTYIPLDKFINLQTPE
jgi:hypothetical protein